MTIQSAGALFVWLGLARNFHGNPLPEKYGVRYRRNTVRQPNLRFGGMEFRLKRLQCGYSHAVGRASASSSGCAEHREWLDSAGGTHSSDPPLSRSGLALPLSPVVVAAFGHIKAWQGSAMAPRFEF